MSNLKTAAMFAALSMVTSRRTSVIEPDPKDVPEETTPLEERLGNPGAEFVKVLNSSEAGKAAMGSDVVKRASEPYTPPPLDYEYSWYLYREIMVELITKIRLTDKQIQRRTGITRVRLNKLFASKKRGMTRTEWTALLKLCKELDCHPYAPPRPKRRVITVPSEAAVKARLEKDLKKDTMNTLPPGVDLDRPPEMPERVVAEGESSVEGTAVAQSDVDRMELKRPVTFDEAEYLLDPIHQGTGQLNRTVQFNGVVQPNRNTHAAGARIREALQLPEVLTETIRKLHNTIADNLVHGDPEKIHRYQTMLRAGHMPPWLDLTEMVTVECRPAVETLNRILTNSN